MSGPNYEAWVDTNTDPDEFMNWAWGGDDNLSEAITGWISFNCRNQNICGTSNYKVVLGGQNEPPTVAISCDPPTCEGFHGVPRGQPGALDIVYSANDDGIFSWQFKVDGAPKISGNNVTNEQWLATNESIGSHTAVIEATDTSGTVSASTNFEIKQDIEAGFMCTLDRPEAPNCQPNSSWKVCGGLRPFKGQWVYFKDDPNLSEHSIPSEGATITNRTWQLKGTLFSHTVFPQGCPTDSSYEYATAPQVGAFKVRLDITDSKGKTDYVEHTLNGRFPPPDWREIPPF
ncbi:MAG: hypothetical protein HY979_00225 [Candidatus Magasanikbacteria bacterium]|nr:hypothetical protein [Candidatus Magasanikbacteria bacterium]